MIPLQDGTDGGNDFNKIEEVESPKNFQGPVLSYDDDAIKKLTVKRIYIVIINL